MKGDMHESLSSIPSFSFFFLTKTNPLPSDQISGVRCPRGVIVKVMDCKIVGSEFELQLRYYVPFRANTLGKGMNPLILPAMG